jgi:hypothetical protein
MAMTIKSIVDDVYADLFAMGKRPDRGRLVRLTAIGENDFASETGCILEEKSQTLTINVTDYTITPTSPYRIVKIHKIIANSKPLDKIEYLALENLPDCYSDVYQDVYCEFLINEKIRLGFTPAATVADTGLKAIIGVEPATAITDQTTNLTLKEIYRKHLVNFVWFKFLERSDPELADKYYKRYMEGVGRVKQSIRKIVEEM